jgi:hypothetical protein
MSAYGTSDEAARVYSKWHEAERLMRALVEKIAADGTNPLQEEAKAAIAHANLTACIDHTEFPGEDDEDEDQYDEDDEENDE